MDVMIKDGILKFKYFRLPNSNCNIYFSVPVMGHYIQDQPNFYPIPNIPESYMVSKTLFVFKFSAIPNCPTFNIDPHRCSDILNFLVESSDNLD